MNSHIEEELRKLEFIKQKENRYYDGTHYVKFDSMFWIIEDEKGNCIDEGMNMRIHRLFEVLRHLKKTA